MGNNMCGIASAPVSAQVPTTKNAAVEQYLNVIRRISSNDTISIRETVKWLITATESFDLPQMHESLSRIAMWHEKQADLVLRSLDRYDASKVTPQTPLLATPIQKLIEIKKKALDDIMNMLAYGLTNTGICKFHVNQPLSNPNLTSVSLDTIESLHDYIGKRAAREYTPEMGSSRTPGFLASTIKCQSRYFAEQTKNLDHERMLTLDELGWNFRRLADYCDKLKRSMVAELDESDSKGNSAMDHDLQITSIPEDKMEAVRDYIREKHQDGRDGTKRSITDFELRVSAPAKTAYSDQQTAYGMANKDMVHILWMLSGLVTTTIIHRHDDPTFLEAERTMSADVQRALEESKDLDASRKLTTEEQIGLIEENLKKILAYIEVCQSAIINRDQAGKDFDGNRIL